MAGKSNEYTRLVSDLACEARCDRRTIQRALAGKYIRGREVATRVALAIAARRMADGERAA